MSLPRAVERLGPWWRRHRRRLLELWAVGVVASVIVTAASAVGYLEGMQARALDLVMRLAGDRLVSDVVVVAIDEAAFEALGQRQPLPRDYLAQLVRGLQRAGAAVIGLDVSVAAATTEAADGALAASIRGFAGDDGVSRVVLVSGAVPGAGPLADPALLQVAIRGSPDVPQDADGLIRRVALLVPGAGALEPAFGLAVVARLGGMSRAALAQGLAAGGALGLPVERRGRLDPIGAPLDIRPGELLRINFVGRPKSFLTIPSHTVAALAAEDADVPHDNPLRGRIVLVGATFAESRDFFATPYGTLPGVEIHANVAHMLLTRSFIRRSGWVASFGLEVLAVLVAGVVLVVVRPGRATLLCVGGTLLVGLPASLLLFQRGGYWVDFLLPTLVTCALGLVSSVLERRRFRAAFGRYVSKEIVAQVLAESPALSGERREVSVLFSDLRGFTTLSETTPPERMAALLNEYFDVMTAAIFRYRGMINDFIGDAVMAVFGAPLADRDHALHAVRAALAMDAALEELNAKWKEQGLPLFRMGIGIHSGEVFAGNVGGRSRVKYTLIGDAVNVGSRVEGLNKELGTTILLTEATLAHLGARVTTRDCGAREVKGRAQHVHVFELLALVGDDDPMRPQGEETS